MLPRLDVSRNDLMSRTARDPIGEWDGSTTDIMTFCTYMTGQWADASSGLMLDLTSGFGLSYSVAVRDSTQLQLLIKNGHGPPIY